jgi:hypothetical protein
MRLVTMDCVSRPDARPVRRSTFCPLDEVVSVVLEVDEVDI